VLVLVLVLGLAGCGGSAPLGLGAAPGETGRVARVVDGDTVDVAGLGTVRLVGIDTPERGECGFEAASVALEQLVLGRSVRLVPGAQDDRDRYDRLLRYVDQDGEDAGLALLEAGLAIARYDSRDGYGAHPRERRYVAADRAAPDVRCR
jgi:endonuclease YncB( thermonuclease family)